MGTAPWPFNHASRYRIPTRMLRRRPASVRVPRAIMPLANLAQFVGAHFVDGLLVSVRVVLDGNLRRHASHRKRAAAMAGLDEELRIRPQERCFHRYLATIREHERRIVLQR